MNTKERKKTIQKAGWGEVKGAGGGVGGWKALSDCILIISFLQYFIFHLSSRVPALHESSFWSSWPLKTPLLQQNKMQMFHHKKYAQHEASTTATWTTTIQQKSMKNNNKEEEEEEENNTQENKQEDRYTFTRVEVYFVHRYTYTEGTAPFPSFFLSSSFSLSLNNIYISFSSSPIHTWWCIHTTHTTVNYPPTPNHTL